MKGLERQRGAPTVPSRANERRFTGTDALTEISSVAGVLEDAICPGCGVLSKLITLTRDATSTGIGMTMIPAYGEALIRAKAFCVLCTAAQNPRFRSEQTKAGHIWFMIGGPDTMPQDDINKEIWRAILGSTATQRSAMRNNLVIQAAARSFGRLQKVHEAITEAEHRWFLERMRTEMGDEATGLLDEEHRHAVLAMLGVVWLLEARRPVPAWKDRVRLFPTPEGVEIFRAQYAADAVIQGKAEAS